MHMQLFDFKDKQIRVFEINGETHLSAKDICDILGLKNVSAALRRLDDDEKGIISNDTLGGKQETLTVNEAGFYTLVLSSKKAIAKPLKRFVAHDVLPQIRETGKYEPQPQQPQNELQLIARLATETDKRLNTLEQGQKKLETKLDNTPIRSDGVKRSALQGKIKQYAYVLGGSPIHYQQAYRKLRPYFGIAAFDDIPLRRYDEAITVIQNWIDEEEYQQKIQGKLYESNGELVEV